MLLEAILKHSQRAMLTEEATAIAHALHVMTVVPNQANDMMDIGRLQGFDEKAMVINFIFHKLLSLPFTSKSRPVQTIHPTDLGLLPSWISMFGAPAQEFSLSWDHF